MSRNPWFVERLEPMRHPREHGQVCEHIARYEFARERLAGRLLDAGCGTGYGTHLLASAPGIASIVGIDLDARAIAWARRFYPTPKAHFARGDLLAPALGGWGMFDGVICFEVLEHLDEPERLLQRLDDVLAPGGRLLISTPLGRGRAVPTQQPFHRFQLTRDEFMALLARRFRVRLFGQKGTLIEEWRRGGRYFLMLALCRSRC